MPCLESGGRGPKAGLLSTSNGALLIALLAVAAPVAAQDGFNLQFDHTTLLVTDLDASDAFYAGILQLEPLETPWGPSAPGRFFSLGGGGQLHLTLTDGRVVSDKNTHLALAVQGLDAYMEFLTERGVAYGNFPGTSSDPQVRPDGVRQIYLQDPDGNWIEINEAARPPR